MRPSQLRRRRLGVALAVALSGCGTAEATRVPAPELPRADEILALRFDAEVGRELGAEQAVGFDVPADRIAPLLAALRPGDLVPDPEKWTVAGVLEVRRRDGRKWLVMLFETPAGPVAYRVDDDRGAHAYYRGGASEAVWDKIRRAYEAEPGAVASPIPPPK